MRRFAKRAFLLLLLTLPAIARGEAALPSPESVRLDTLLADSLPPALPDTARPTRFLDRVAEMRGRVVGEIEDPKTPPLRKARLLVSIGRLDEAEKVLAAYAPPNGPARRDVLLLRSEESLREYDFEGAESTLALAERIDPSSEEAFRLRIDLLRNREDLARIDALTHRRLVHDSTSVAGLLGRAALDFDLLRVEEAERRYEKALALATSPESGVRALSGLVRVAEKRKELDVAVELASQALGAGPPDPPLLNTVVSLLIRLGENGEAIDLAHEVLRWDPLNEEAHYLLGNGYAKRNYTELEREYPRAFPDSGSAPLLAQIRGLLEARRRVEARSHLRAIKTTRPALADPDLLLGAMFWDEGNPDSAIAHFGAALGLCPEYGRAHNGFAKGMELKRLYASAKRERWEREFAGTDLPDIPRIEEFVSNYASLSERHRKRVALSIEPWARFVPVLVEAGATIYIKPLYERLSETPNQGLLRDLRISYDSRLWDDVRGCGGYHTVTGIEDVERSVFRKYNTLLHELTHQVHYILTPDEKRAIQDAYRAAKERERTGENRFLSRYQGSSVWEYFAEGMNSYASPTSDPYDVREVVRERLDELDPDLLMLIEKIASDTAVEKYYVPAFVVSAHDRIENGHPEEALEMLKKALEREREDEGALCALAYTYTLLGNTEQAVRTAETAAKTSPESAEPWLEQARAVYHGSGSRSDRIAILLKSREHVDTSQRYLIELALGEAYLGRGDLASAGESFRWVLRYQEDNPEALWGVAVATGLASDTAKADAYFVRAIRERSGVAELRADYARYLARRGSLEKAEEQIREARLIDPRSSEAEAAAGLVAIYREEWTEARRRLAEALALAPHNDLATILLAHTWIATGDPARAGEILTPVLEAVRSGAPPDLVYMESKGEYREIHAYPAEERWLLYRTASELAEAKGDAGAAERYRRLMEQSFR